MAYATITVFAPRIRPFNPERPENKVLLFEIDERHPGGQAFLAEGNTADVYPTAAVKERLGDGRLVKVDPKAPQPDVEAIDPNSLYSLTSLDEPTIKTLEGAGFGDVSALVLAWRSGDVQKINGVGKGRLAQIKHALVAASHIGEDE